jgi:hypothetical protein
MKQLSHTSKVSPEALWSGSVFDFSRTRRHVRSMRNAHHRSERTRARCLLRSPGRSLRALQGRPVEGRLSAIPIDLAYGKADLVSTPRIGWIVASLCQLWSNSTVAAALAARPVYLIADDLLQCPSRQPRATQRRSGMSAAMTAFANERH